MRSSTWRSQLQGRKTRRFFFFAIVNRLGPETESQIQSTQALGRSPRRDLGCRHGACVRVRLRILSTLQRLRHVFQHSPTRRFQKSDSYARQKPRRTRRHTLQLRTHFSRENRKMSSEKRANPSFTQWWSDKAPCERTLSAEPSITHTMDFHVRVQRAENFKRRATSQVTRKRIL